MMPTSKIITVALYEAKVLWRSWFFRIFAAISLILLVSLNIALLVSSEGSPWVMRAIPANIPYVNTLMLNLFQTILAVFLATGFLKRDMVLDTTEVVYIRSMTNEAYIIGKAVGNGIVFLGLNLLVMVIAFIFNAFAPDVPVRALPYLYYPLVISLPTLSFTFGAAFLLMAVIRNQAIVLVALVGALSIGFFFLPNALYSLFDVTGFTLPLMYSDFTGFGDGWVLLQRATYLMAGVGCVILTAGFLKRLPQSLTIRRLSIVVGISCIAVSIACGVVYSLGQYQKQRMRQSMIQEGNRSFSDPKPTPVSYDLVINHKGTAISATAKIVLRNDTQGPLTVYALRLNPGLKVLRVKGSGAPRFTRKLHVLRVTPGVPLAPGSVDTLAVEYSGAIADPASYLDISDKATRRASAILLYHRLTSSSFVTPSYVLLTPETQFYPMIGAGFSSDHPEYEWRSLSTFEMKATTRSGLTAISQGAARKVSSGSWTFTPETPLPGVSLIIGNYAKRSAVVDSVEYSLMTLPSHRFFVPFFTLVKDTIPALIRELRTDYEGEIGMKFPYSRLSLIETPLQFTAYQRLWTQNYETVQPEMVLLPENGMTLTEADFKRPQFRPDRQGPSEEDVQTPQEEQISRFRRFVSRTIIAGAGGNPFRGMPDDAMGPLLSQASLPSANYSIFADFYRFTTIATSDEWPVFSAMMESYYRTRAAQGGGRDMFRRMSNISNVEKVNIGLRELGLAGMLKDPKYTDLAQDAISSLGTSVFTRLRKEFGSEAFDSLMQEMLVTHRFGVLHAQEFCDTARSRYGVDVGPIFSACYDRRDLPGYSVDNVEAYEFRDSISTKYQVVFDIRNCDSSQGLAVAAVRGGGRGGPGRGEGGGGPSAQEYIVSLAPLQTKKVGMVLERQPRMMTVNTLISRNLPSVLMFNFDRIKPREGVHAFAGDTVIMGGEERDTGIIIVDNEDPGFKIETQETGGLFQRIFKKSTLDGTSKYADMRRFQPPSTWTATVGPFYYGTFVHSACFVKGGNGSQKVSWTGEIPQSGTYGVYAYIPNFQRRFRDRGRGGETQPQDQGEYQYIVRHEETTETVPVKVQGAEDGWNLLGTYYFPAGKATVELTDKFTQRVVIGDAVKWVKE